DDEYAPDHLETRREILQSHPSCQFLHGGIRVVGNPFVPDRLDPRKKIHVSKCAVSGSFFVKSNALKFLKGFRKPTLGTDADFLEQVHKNGLMMMKTEIPTYSYHRDMACSITHGK